MAVDTVLKINEDALAEETQRVIKEISEELFDLSQRNITINQTIDRGTLLKSGQLVHRKLESEVSYPVPYALAIENGRTPGTMPPVTKIQEWAVRKGIGGSIEESKSLAWAIATKIKKDGTEPKPYMQPAIETVKRKYLSGR